MRSASRLTLRASDAAEVEKELRRRLEVAEERAKEAEENARRESSGREALAESSVLLEE